MKTETEIQAVPLDPQTAFKKVFKSTKEPEASGVIDRGEMVDWVVWDANQNSSILKASSVEYKRGKELVRCVFRNTKKKVVLRVDAVMFTEKPIQPIGML